MPNNNAGSGGAFKWVLLAVAVVGLLILVRYGLAAYADKVAADEARRLEAQLTGDPAYGKALTLMKARFPEDYAATKTGAEAIIKAGKAKDMLGTYVFQETRQFRARHNPEFAAASPPALSQFRKAQIRWYEAVQKVSVEDCAWAMLPKTTRLIKSNDDIRAATGDLLYAVINAAVDGQRTKVYRGSPGGRSFLALSQAMVREGIHPDEVGVIVTSQIDTFPPDRGCAVGLSTFRAIDSLPEEDADAITISIFQARPAPTPSTGD
jgi:hypothetical protein